MSDYLPINKNSLRTNTIIGCNIYLLVKTTANTRFILYCNENTVFENKKREMLLESNIDRLFIEKDDSRKFHEYLEKNFKDILSDKNISSDEKTKMVYSTAKNLMKDVFDNPRVGNIERTKTYAYNMVDYILKEGRNAHGLLKIAIHEYYTYTHSVNVATVGTLFTKELGFAEDELKQFCSGILLHDIGKTKISNEIISKNGKLTKEEFAEIKKHPELGVAILKETGNGFEDEYTITLQHHENYDGTGYPHGLHKDEIPLCGKIARIIDVYDALTTERSYKEAMRPFAAILLMKEEMLNCFDKELFKEFIRFAGPYDPRKEKRSNDYLQN